MGWGEQKSISSNMVANAELLRKASWLADHVVEHRRNPTPEATESMYFALDAFLETRRQLLFG